MEIQLRHCPSFGVARCIAGATEAVKAEAGSMLAHSLGMHLEAQMEGGLLKGLKRGVLGGESLYISTFTAPAEGGWLDLAAKLPGDLRVIQLDGAQGWLVERGNWLGSEASVEIDTKWSGFKSLIGGEGGFMVHLSGAGQAIVASYGAIEPWSLEAGQTVVIDTNHVLAFPDTMQYELKRAVEGRSIQSAKSAEGFVFHFTGPGEVMIQSRNQQQLLAWIASGVGSRE